MASNLDIWARPRTLGAMNTAETRRFVGVDRRTIGRMIAGQRPASPALVAYALCNNAATFGDLFTVRPR